MPQLGLAPLGFGEGDVGIELSPDELDRNVERLELGQTLGVLGERIEELRRHLDECRARAGLGDEVLADQWAEESVEVGLLRVRKGIPEFLLLPGQQPAELLGALGDRHRKRMEALGREERNHLGPKDRRVFGIGRVEHDHGVDAGGVCERVVDRCGPGRIVGDRDDLSQAQHLDDRFEVTELLFETVDSTGGFVGTAKTQEIECDDPPPASYQVGDQVVVDV